MTADDEANEGGFIDKLERGTKGVEVGERDVNDDDDDDNDDGDDDVCDLPPAVDRIGDRDRFSEVRSGTLVLLMDTGCSFGIFRDICGFGTLKSTSKLNSMECTSDTRRGLGRVCDCLSIRGIVASISTEEKRVVASGSSRPLFNRAAGNTSSSEDPGTEETYIHGLKGDMPATRALCSSFACSYSA